MDNKPRWIIIVYLLAALGMFSVWANGHIGEPAEILGGAVLIAVAFWKFH